ncbi:MAG: HupE/UreJ family protein [Sphingomonas sp.]|nr:HupE/UreJ family protein [Sphingomonas sp.]
MLRAGTARPNLRDVSTAGLIGRAVAVAGLLAVLVNPVPAHSHDGTGLAGGFVAGFQHPLLGLDHMLAMVSVGLWGAFLGRPLVIALPVLFPIAMAIGAAAGMVALPVPPVELGIAASVLTLGLMILLAVRASIPVACAVVGMFALFHGYAHGVELPSAADPVGYTTGFIFSTGLLHVAGIAIGMLRRVPAGTKALRATGGVIAAFGAWFIAGTLA